MVSATDIIPGIPALWSSLKLINAVGIQEIQARIVLLTSLLIEEIGNKVKIVTPIEEERRSGIITIATQNDEQITQLLAAEGMHVSKAYASGTGGIRVAPHFFNTEEEIHRFSKRLKELV